MMCNGECFAPLSSLLRGGLQVKSAALIFVLAALIFVQVGQGHAALSSSVSAETMLCFACGEIRYKKQWSVCQWGKAMQLVKGLDQWKRNCCKQCSDVPGWCFNRKLEEVRSQQMSCKAADYDSGTTPPSATSKPAPVALRSTLPFAADIDSAKKYKKLLMMNLRNNVAAVLWMWIREKLIELNLTHQEKYWR